jgi:hypothetical protein
MLDVHPPHAATHSWKDFFIHVATICVGLLIAVGLEQTVEYFHHRSEARDLREQMRGVFENNLKLEPTFLSRTGEFRAYMVELRTAVEARRSGHPLPTEPDRNDPRMRAFTATPSLAPYDAAMQNGTVALLSSNEIRLYNRVGKQREYVTDAITDWMKAISNMEDFEKQFTASPGSIELLGIVTTPDLSRLSPAELLEYRKLIAAVINSTDRLMTRTILIDTMGQAILDGVTDEDQLMSATVKQLGDDPWKDLGQKKP